MLVFGGCTLFCLARGPFASLTCRPGTLPLGASGLVGLRPRAASAHKACEHALQTQQGNRVHWGILVPFVARTVGGGDQHGWHALRGFVSENSTMQWLLTVSASLASLAFFWKIPWKIGLGKVVGYLDSDPFNVQQRIQTPNKRVTGVISPQNDWSYLTLPKK